MANYRPDEEVSGIVQPFQLAFLLDNEPTKGPDWRPTDKNGPTPSDKPNLAKGESEKDSSEDASKESDSSATDSQASSSSSDLEDGNMSPLVIGTVVAVVVVFIGIAGAIAYQNKKRKD